LGFEHTKQMLDQRRFPGAIAADQPEHSASRDAQSNFIEGSLAAKRPGQVFDMNKGRCRTRKWIDHG
jgi:hypothetical protein